MKQEIIADLSRITEEEQAILDGKTEVEKERYSSGQKFVMDAGKLLERGKLIDIRPHTRFIRFPAHSHNYVEMIYMCQGSTVHTINGDRIELKTGELLILNQNAVQEIEPAGRDDIAVNFLILPEFFDQTLRMIGAEENQLKDFIVGCLVVTCCSLCWSTYALYEQNEDLRAEKIELYSRLSTAEREHVKLEELVIKLERKARWRNHQ